MTTTENTSVSQNLAPFSEINAALEALKSRHTGVVHDVKTTVGMKAARADRAEVKEYRVSVEKKRVELKAPHLEAGREIDAEAARITKELTKLELDYDKQIRAEDLRKEREAKEEADRKAAEAQAIRDAELAEERRLAAEREAALQAERDATEKANRELREQLAVAQAAIEAAKPVQAEIMEPIKGFDPVPIIDVPAGWERVEAGFEVDSEPTVLAKPKSDPWDNRSVGTGYQPLTASVARVSPVRASFDSTLLDLLDGETAQVIAKASNHAATAFVLPDDGLVFANLSDAAKRRTSPRNVADVLEAIRFIRDGR